MRHLTNKRISLVAALAGCAALVLSGFLCGCNNGDAEEEARACFDRAFAHFEKGQYEAAIAAFKKAIAIKPDFAEAYNNRAVVHYFRRQYDKAWADVNTCRKLGGKVNRVLLAALRKASE